MSAENRGSRPLSPWILGVTVACLATVSATSEATQLPALEPTTIDVDITSLPAGEKAALARIIHAGRLMDALYIRQVWPGTAELMKERESADSPSALAELTDLNFFKGDSAHLQELEDQLPLAPELRGRKLGSAAPVLVLDVIYQGGLTAAGGAHFGYGLPNDLRVLNAVGARTATYRNIAKVDYQTIYAPIADVALANSARSTLQFDDVLDEILMVRLFDSLGPQFVTGTTQPIADALQAKAGVAGQIRSMLLSLWGHRYLIEHGYLESRDGEAIYAAFLVPALDRVRGGLDRPRSQGSTYILNHLIEAGAIQLDADGRFAIDPVRADAEVTRAAGEFVSLMAKGDLVAIEALLGRYVTVSPEVRAVLKRIGAAPHAAM